ncbi:hypothetical protein CYY_004793 [Polysphondylium violaceum]|uniref:SNF2-related domain-containing protein n=1 Tax=Polysphondylium violaceum TaxID=133409 RepID=A0A8J4UZ16_9MYCE|nr:hypothetical protein CYY_004793 [Polysphondylium violaceum]
MGDDALAIPQTLHSKRQSIPTYNYKADDAVISSDGDGDNPRSYQNTSYDDEHASDTDYEDEDDSDFNPDSDTDAEDNTLKKNKNNIKQTNGNNTKASSAKETKTSTTKTTKGNSTKVSSASPPKTKAIAKTTTTTTPATKNNNNTKGSLISPPKNQVSVGRQTTIPFQKISNNNQAHDIDTTNWTSKNVLKTGDQDTKNGATNTAADTTKYFSFTKVNSTKRLSSMREDSKVQPKLDFFSSFLFKTGNDVNSSQDKVTKQLDNEFDKQQDEDDEDVKVKKSNSKPNLKKNNRIVEEDDDEKEDEIVIEDDEETEPEDNIVVNKKRRTKQNSLLDTPTKNPEPLILDKKKGKKLAQKFYDMEKEGKEEQEEEDDEKTEDEKDTSVIIDPETINIEDDQDTEEEIDKHPTIDKLITACEYYSERMLRILSGFENKDIKNTNGKSEIEGHTLINQPTIIKNEMRNYQLIGLNWMALLYKEKINGILADEMGLGKTVQTISLLAYIYESLGDKGPHIIIVPATTLSNWERELNMWCPKLKIYKYYGTLREREFQREELRSFEPGTDFNVILTTYNLLFSNIDRGFLKRFNYSYLILDEAQNIKNSDSKRYKNIFKVESHHRLLLTGTPLQNNLFELWSLLNFLMPHIFGASKKDNSLYSQLLSHDKEESKDKVLLRMKKILSPFILRRLKSTVSQELKPKVEIIEYCKMQQIQSDFYQKVIQQTKKAWTERDVAQREVTKKRKKTTLLANNDEDELIDLDSLDSGGGTGKGKTGQGLMSNILMMLRKATNHPLLCKQGFYNQDQLNEIAKILQKESQDFKDYSLEELKEMLDTWSDYEIHCTARETPCIKQFSLRDEQITDTSAKCVKLKEILEKEIDQNGSKVLIFSQMTKLLDILQEILVIQNRNFMRLDGTTPVGTRQSIIDDFTNSTETNIFLLSTNAGGLGINLICANVVIFFDMSFNPQVDRQAEDRAHRLGQKKDVFVYKLITEDSVDKNILDSSNEKKKLNDSMLEEGTFDQESSKLESKKILQILDHIFK